MSVAVGCHQAVFAGGCFYMLDEVLLDEPDRRGECTRQEAKAGNAIGAFIPSRKV